MKRSRLRNTFLYSKSNTDRKVYNAQRNLCISVIRQAKRQFFSNLNTHNVNCKTNFWRTVKLFFDKKLKLNQKITLTEKKYKDNLTKYSQEIISDGEEKYNKLFVKFVPSLKIPARHNCNKNFQETNDPVSIQ